jgi:hypothetical protein
MDNKKNRRETNNAKIIIKYNMEENQKPKRENKRVEQMWIEMRAFVYQLNQLIEEKPYQIIWVSKKKAAELYGVSTRTIHNWAEKGDLQIKTIGTKTFYCILPLLK